MGDPSRADALNRQHNLINYRQPGLDIGEDFHHIQHEHNRRQKQPDEVAPAQIVAGGGGGQATPQAQPPPPPVTSPVIDRLHKWAPSYIIVSQDHFPGEDPILPPGYAVVGRASSINDGYAKAKEELAKRPSGAHVVLGIWGGDWTEDLTLDTDNVNISGMGTTPKITGSWVIGPTTYKTHLFDLRLVSKRPLDPTYRVPFTPPWAALFIEPLNTTPHFDINFENPGILIEKCFIEGYETPFVAWRRFYSENTRYSLYLDPMYDNRFSPCVAVFASQFDYRLSVFHGGAIQGRYQVPLVPLPPFIQAPEPAGYAALITASSTQRLDTFYTANQLILNGVAFDNVDIFGRVTNQAWRTLFNHSRCYSYNTPFLDVQGAPLTGTNDLFGTAHFDLCKVRASVIGTFSPLPTVGEGSGGGTIRWRNSNHTIYFGATPAGAAFGVNPNGTGALFVQGQGTSSPAWATAGITLVTDGNSPTGIDPRITYDEYFR